MIVLDANVLIYCYNADAPQHTRAAEWVDNLLAGPELIGLPWLTLWAFLRIATNARISTRPLSKDVALGILKGWLDEPRVLPLHPGPNHLQILERLVTRYSAVGASVTDAVLAAIAIENGATLASTDQDFRRFPELRWVNPLA